MSFVGKYAEHLQNLANHRHCEGIICMHIHTLADRQVGDLHYLNSGDWVEAVTAVVENLDRSFEIITYQDFCIRTGRNPNGCHLLGADDPVPEKHLDEDEEHDDAGAAA